MKIERILFFGTPEFAVPTLEALVTAGRRPMQVITQPSRPAGRGKRLQPPPVAVAAQRLELPVAQPLKVKSADFLGAVEAWQPDVAVVVAFGQIFPRRLLALPKAGCINLHASLLPAWRGAAPIQAAIAHGDATTGVCTMQMEAGLDTGPALLCAETPIGEAETSEELSERLAFLGAELTVRTLDALEAGELTPKPQDDARATYAPRILKADGAVDWNLPARELFDRLRAFTPWPGLTARLGDKPVRLGWARVLTGQDATPPSDLADELADLPGGTLLGLRGDDPPCLAVLCGRAGAPADTRGVLGLEELQRPGKRALPAVDFCNGERLHPGDRFDLSTTAPSNPPAGGG